MPSTTTVVPKGTTSHQQVVSGLSIPKHDYVSLSYTGSNLTQVVYKSGGILGQVVCTVNLTYDVANNLIAVVKDFS
jgi:hypothetical protein